MSVSCSECAKAASPGLLSVPFPSAPGFPGAALRLIGHGRRWGLAALAVCRRQAEEAAEGLLSVPINRSE